MASLEAYLLLALTAACAVAPGKELGALGGAAGTGDGVSLASAAGAGGQAGSAGAGANATSTAGSGGQSGGAASSTAGSAGSAGNAGNAEAESGQVWTLDNLSSVAGLTPEVWGAPKLAESPYGTALCFDGDDAIVLSQNPLEGASAFTLQVLFRPDPVADAALAEPRFVHIETSAADRVTVEARIAATQFYLDTFLSSGGASKTLSDATRSHPLGQWHWAALSYADGKLRHYVDGSEDAAADITAAPLGPGKTSLGARQNRVDWFVGCIRELRFAARALETAALARPQ